MVRPGSCAAEERLVEKPRSCHMSHTRRSPAPPGSDAAELSSEGFSDELAPYAGMPYNTGKADDIVVRF